MFSIYVEHLWSVPIISYVNLKLILYIIFASYCLPCTKHIWGTWSLNRSIRQEKVTCWAATDSRSEACAVHWWNKLSGLYENAVGYIYIYICIYIWEFPEIGGTPKSSFFIRFSNIYHTCWRPPIFGIPLDIFIYIYRYIYICMHACMYIHIYIYTYYNYIYICRKQDWHEWVRIVKWTCPKECLEKHKGHGYHCAMIFTVTWHHCFKFLHPFG